ncbi:MAG: sigma E factor regulator [Anaerofustis stercorihominis]|nr:sigma E factor regulator [Anaerofustis stercorihominis]
MREKALVTELKANNMAVVQVQRSTACENCGACSVGKEKLVVSAEVENLVGANVGDEVDVEMEFSGVMGASFFGYGVPFIAFITGLFLGFYVMPKIIPLDANFLGFAFGALFMAAGYLGVKFMDKKGAFKEKFKIRIIK